MTTKAQSETPMPSRPVATLARARSRRPLGADDRPATIQTQQQRREADPEPLIAPSASSVP